MLTLTADNIQDQMEGVIGECLAAGGHLPIKPTDFIRSEKIVKGEPYLRSVVACLTAFHCKVSDRPFGGVPEAERLPIVASFVSFHQLGATLPTAGLLCFLRAQISILQSRVRTDQHQFLKQVKENLTPKLKSTARQFSKSVAVIAPKTVLKNAIDHIRSVFGGPIRRDLKELTRLKSLCTSKFDEAIEEPQRHAREFKAALFEDWRKNNGKHPNARDFVMLLRAMAKVAKKPAECEIPEETKSQMVADIDAMIEGLRGCVTRQYVDVIKPILVSLDFFLQCTWLVAIMNAVMAHPPPDVFREFLVDMTYDESGLADEDLRQMVRDMGRDKMTTVSSSAELIAFFRTEYLECCGDLLSTYSIPAADDDDLDLVSDITGQEEEQEQIQQVSGNEFELVYTFPAEFAALQNKDMKDLKKFYIDALVYKFSDRKETEEEEEEGEETKEAKEES